MMKRLTAMLIALLLLVACTPEQNYGMSQINDARRQAGVHELWGHVTLNFLAQDYANHLAATKVLRHADDIAAGMPEGWVIVGENVGMGPNMDAIFNAFMNSPSHADNILSPKYDWMGTGVATDENGTVWYVQRFARFS